MQIAHNRWIPWRLAFDVGVKGCVSAFNVETTELRLFELPYEKRALAPNPDRRAKFESVPLPATWLEMLDGYTGAQAIIEDLAAYSGGYSFADGSLLEAFGMIQMACAAHKIELITAHPRTWKAFMFMGRGGAKADKYESVLLSRALFPAAEDVLLKTKDGRADSLNLLYYDLLGEPERMRMKALKIRPYEPLAVKFAGLLNNQRRK